MAKIRQGFVSNSSSCSFIVAGVMVDEDRLDLVKLVKSIYPDIYEECVNKYEDSEVIEECLYDCISNDGTIVFSDHPETGARKGKVLIGVSIAEEDEFMLGDTEMSLDEINTKCKELLNKVGLDDEEVKIITGTRMC